ncbi:MAG: bacillithiol biosynthesis cysteine-adding enzyme BshC [Croceitalea sp.]|nr:bacillithiol biosynthesis cysteine-adding enzyme BshC [Croceitalea sp.]NNC33460.1 bacillithiol biosynthesis cysteine-adding enzyme BshC [Croceitalea sp.]NNM19279.1 bacillithiol biosynthesis cysteine-adding enzyme BshC [Croceitalea sp.]
MDIDCIPFQQTGYFSKLICDYLDQKKALSPFYNHFPSLDNFKLQLEEKETNYDHDQRNVLVKALVGQYAEISPSALTKTNIKKLSSKKTFTIVTGHQLNLFTGPLYFLYKIISTINLASELKTKYADYEFVPVYWMATEDHDFDEINYFNFRGQKVQWNLKANGGVGRLSTESLKEVQEVIATHFGESENAQKLTALFKKSYLENDTLAKATRYLANELFGKYGLVVVDGDAIELKRLFVPYIEKDIFEQIPFKKVNESVEQLKSISTDYNIQVNPREINHFYLTDNLRERLIYKNEIYHVLDTDISFTPDELRKELNDHPERFSPNVITRPLYQEVILPNLCYIGGGGELAYWLELKASFDSLNIAFPMLLLRNSVLLMTGKQRKKVKKLGLSVYDLFMKQSSLINKKIRQISNIDIDFSPQKKHLEEQFAELYELAEQTDKSFLGAVKAQETKQKNGLDALEKRLLKAQKRKLKDEVTRIADIQNELFPNHSLQERLLNFSELYLEYGDQLIPMLKEALDPLKGEFHILRD